MPQSIELHVLPVTPFMQNCSIIVCQETNKAALVDPGGDADRIQLKIEQLGAVPEKVFLTHGHMDHVSAAKQIAEQYQIPIEGPHKAEQDLLDSLPLWCQQVGFPHTDPFHPDRWLEQGDTVEFGNQQLEVYFTPGHTPGHVIFFHRKDQLAWVGDVLFQGSIGRTDFPGGDHQTLIDSITQVLWPLGDEVQFVPGHGPMSSFGQERQTNAFVADHRFG